MIDESRVNILIEKINSAQAASEQSYEKFHEILSLIDEFFTIVNGYPLQTIELLNNVNEKLDKIYDEISNKKYFSVKNNNNNNKCVLISFLNFILMIFFVVLGSFLGTIFHGILFHR